MKERKVKYIYTRFSLETTYIFGIFLFSFARWVRIIKNTVFFNFDLSDRNLKHRHRILSMKPRCL